ncbi:MAG: hypothetical protein JKY84_07790, partial [Emcibacteraceae bacterium]|nr:hypothetical protein [Emcibacteraceae bacterium]
DVIDEISPWFSGKIILADSNIGKFRMTGVYDVHDPVAALQALVNPHGGVVHQITPWLIIISSQ